MLDITKHREFTQGLRDLAQFIDENPDIALPHANQYSVYEYNTVEDAAMLAGRLRPFEKKYEGEVFAMVKNFGPHSLRFVFMRGAVCKPVVVGKRIIPATKAKVIPERIVEGTPEREEEIVEWQCGSSLLNAGNLALGRGTTIEMEVEPLQLAEVGDGMPF